MAVFEYSAVSEHSEGHVESGIVVASDKLDAFDKLKRQSLTEINLRRLEGFNAFLRQFTANVK